MKTEAARETHASSAYAPSASSLTQHKAPID